MGSGAILNIDTRRFSETVGLIYDAALDSTVWPAALKSMCGYIGASMGTINVVNPSDRSLRLASDWGCDPYWINQLYTKYMALMPLWPAFQQVELDRAYNTDQLIELMPTDQREGIRDTQFFKEWAEPVGLLDLATTTIWRSASLGAVFSLHTPDSRTLVSEEELDLVALFTPHVKRSVMFGDLLDHKTVSSAVFATSLEAIDGAALVVNDRGNVVYMNALAQALSNDGEYLSVKHSTLIVRDAIPRQALTKALSLATAEEATLGHFGMGIPLSGQPKPVVAYVMPLARRTTLHGWSSDAQAIVLIKTSDEGAEPTIDVLKAVYGLTSAEARVAQAICKNDNRDEAAMALGISVDTLKTHLSRTFEKTGVSSKANLVKILGRIMPPN